MHLDRRALWLLLLACLVLAVVVGVRPGQDANWDLRNYHYYNPHALVHDRYDLDVAPAQIQSWYSPLWDLGYYAMASAGVNSRVLTAVLSLPAGLALFLLVLVARRAAPGLGAVPLAALVLLGATAAGGGPVVGTTMSEWHTVALVLLAVWLLLVAGERPERRLRLQALAGLCGGCAVGFKLTAAPFAVGLGVLLLCLPGRLRQRASGLGALALGGAAGFALVYGWWGWHLYQRYANPLFPYYNDLFGSPLMPRSSFTYDHFASRTLVDLLLRPFRVALPSVSYVGELPLRDPRLAAGAVAAAVLAVRARRRGPHGRGVLALIAFASVSYLGWARMFGILRYAGVLELLAALFVVLAVGELAAVAIGPERPRALLVAGAAATVAAVCGILVATRSPDWGRVAHGAPAVRAEVGAVPPGAMVVIATEDPVAYVVPSLPAGMPVVSLVNNAYAPVPPYEATLQRAAAERVRRHPGPLLLLGRRGNADERYGNASIAELLGQMGLRADVQACSPIRTAIDGDALGLCPMSRPDLGDAHDPPLQPRR
jgi:hypothetical protein